MISCSSSAALSLRSHQSFHPQHASRPRSTCRRSGQRAAVNDPTRPGQDPTTAGRGSWLTTDLLLPGGLLAAAAMLPGPADALEVFPEPANALSLPTWAIHVSSVIEWTAAMGLFLQYAKVTGDDRWRGMTWGMLPSLGSAMAACTWHFFYNAPSLDFLVALQAFLTVVGNTTLWIAAYRIYDASEKEREKESA